VQSIGPQNPYEIYCYECNVTAPLGTRSCIHCGTRLTGPRFQPGALLSKAFEEEETLGADQPRLGGIAPMTIIWILLFVGGSLYRLCH
jgi:hypothetical protein